MNLEAIDVRLKQSLIAVAVVAIVAIGGYFVWFGLLLEEPFSPDQAKWGTFGDFVGGIMNPLVAGCALYWLTMSVRLQKTELAASRAELELTRNELAATRIAQQSQAQTTLIANRLQALNVKITAVTSDLIYSREQVARYWQAIEDYGPQTRKFRHEGKPIDLAQMLDDSTDRALSLMDQQRNLIRELDQLIEKTDEL